MLQSHCVPQSLAYLHIGTLQHHTFRQGWDTRAQRTSHTSGLYNPCHMSSDSPTRVCSHSLCLEICIESIKIDRREQSLLSAAHDKQRAARIRMRGVLTGSNERTEHAIPSDAGSELTARKGPVRCRRAGYTRTKSGCMTCRRRKKKCDEATPIC